ncbi:MAG: hypothetical protein GY806_14315 [Gammaproteobacteria bacterium]|nr:hypothetical protein [Gammaproteobacteria bacterium]
MKPNDMESELAPYGLKLRGVVSLSDDEIREYGFTGQTAVALVGNIGSSYWPEFAQSREYADGEADPLDRWSLRVANEVVLNLNATPIFPFHGPPYLPFQQWAKRAEAQQQSPIGLMIHPQFGLWHSYRFALLIKAADEVVQIEQVSPCLDCIAQPCLNTCPVNAFSTNTYDVDSCAQYLKQTPSADCFKHGCMARFECPVGREYRYVDEQSQFHLQAFIGARMGLDG